MCNNHLEMVPEMKSIVNNRHNVYLNKEKGKLFVTDGLTSDNFFAAILLSFNILLFQILLK